jgi:hypothetical protein
MKAYQQCPGTQSPKQWPGTQSPKQWPGSHSDTGLELVCVVECGFALDVGPALFTRSDFTPMPLGFTLCVSARLGPTIHALATEKENIAASINIFEVFMAPPIRLRGRFANISR